VATSLLLRLLLGLGVAIAIRAGARRLAVADGDEDVRASARVNSPVTIASCVLLPMNYHRWDDTTLRIILSHERAHVRQRDFYVLLLAGLHCALFWFNPFAWWLKRQLSDLGEALSDHAAVQHAESRAGYAEMLLAFARQTRRPVNFAATVGVAMARSSNLAQRIDRLLCDEGFERSFAPRRRLPLLAAAAALIAIAAASATPRVAAAVVIDAKTDSVLPPLPPAPMTPAKPDADDGERNGVMAVHIDEFDRHVAEGLRGTHGAAAGDYVYYQEHGKQYLVQDPAILDEAKRLLAPIRALHQQEQDLGRQERALAERERALAERERNIRVDTPDFDAEIAELNQVAEQMRRAKASPQMRPETLAQLQGSLGRIQGRLGRLEARAGARQGALGAEQGTLGEEQGKLGQAQARLGEQSEKLADEMRASLKPLIQHAIQAGKLKPLE
jgi:hypothetical protein